MQIERAKGPRPPLLLLVSKFTNCTKDLVTATLGWMCKQAGWAFDAYYAAPQQGGIYTLDERPMASEGGGLFSFHGSTLLGGRHQQAIARALAQFETTVVRLDDVDLFGSLFQVGAAALISPPGSLVALYGWAVERLGIPMPTEAVAIQNAGLPSGLPYGITQYAYPEVVQRQGLGVPLALQEDAIAELSDLGVESLWTVAVEGSDHERWLQAGLEPQEGLSLSTDETYDSLTFRIAERWRDRATGVDLCEPVLASHWLPYSVMENRLQVCGEELGAAVERLAPLAKETGQLFVYGRYAGGPIGGAKNDEALFPLFAEGLPYQVIEPRRPVLRVFGHVPQPMPRPAASNFDLEPTDEQLRKWATQGKVLTTLLFHSGELSHDDAMINVMELAATTNVRVGLGVQAPRYQFDPDCIEPLHTPIDQGGVLGLCEPVLHSAGWGILAEALTAPRKVTELTRSAREQIAELAGDAFAPRGLYCYLDAVPGRWHEKRIELWQAIADAGFDYVISSVGQGENRVLYRQGDFVVLNMRCCNHYPYSPFVRITKVEQLTSMERWITSTGKPGWIIGVIDAPIFAYANYLVRGESNPSLRKPEIHRGVRLGRIFSYIESLGEVDKLVSATPHTIARYARLLHLEEAP
jgi:hypothetical protein